MKFNRRSLFKKSLLALATVPFLPKQLSVIADAVAKDAGAKDSGIKKQHYVHDVYKALKEPTSKEGKYLAANKKFQKAKKGEFLPRCHNCSFYKKQDKVHKGYGVCTMVGAKGKKGNDFVHVDGVCKVYMHNKKVKS